MRSLYSRDLSISLLFIYCVLYSSCSWKNEFDRTLDSMYELQDKLEYDRKRLEEDSKNGIPPGDFDPNQYFSILKHIRPIDGYVLDFTYFYAGIGGNSKIYLRKINETRKKVVVIELGDNDFEQQQMRKSNYTNSTLFEFIQTDGSIQGYYELVLLFLMGNNFYVYWHGFYETVYPLNGKQTYHWIGLDDIEVPKKIDLSPKVIIKKDQVQVSIVAFNLWHGQVRHTFNLKKEFPHKVISYNYRMEWGPVENIDL